ncbi:MAG: hypothetical protein IPL54_10170 [Chitinophagaceae bacterium]|nr:hypothetical protein [Chitinophagaceae bacterium]
MRFLKSVKYKIVFTVLSVLTVSGMMAQTTAPAAAQPVEPGSNQLATLLMIMIVVLAFVIWGMGQVLTALGRQMVEKSKASKMLSIVIIAGLSLLSQVTFAQDAATPVIKEVPNYGGLSANTYYMFLTVLAMEVFVILFLAFSIRRMYTELLPEKKVPVKEKAALAGWWTALDKKIVYKSGTC